MTLSDEERDAIVFYRIQKAKETLKEAVGIASLGLLERCNQSPLLCLLLHDKRIACVSWIFGSDTFGSYTPFGIALCD